jgi:hypothetical protein
MIESPLIREMMAKNTAETRHKDILRVLARRFGPVPEQLGVAVRAVHDESKLEELLDEAASCLDLESFQKRLLGQA